ncbi:protein OVEREXPRESSOR OF CATIONIC PEROXIDASE 3 [Impatiens glandulifera]|uniref:protein OVEREXPRESSOR OF CATIONIC PEROXIDASE 3 n=1 Tax=Impatiens glandulifera TaxID=253017 RepID=UPI001FB0C8F7|nr:protein OVEREXPRESSOR OF CATIONIC PEROXIDASE 3 [Impatiens glandulifera]
MASSMSSLHASPTLFRLPPPQIGRSLVLNFRSHFIHPLSLSPRLSIALARRQNNTGPVPASFSNKKKKKKENDEDAEEHLFGDALEALFDQLEEDLKNDDSLIEDDDEISEEELMMLERELEEALKDDDLVKGSDSSQLSEVDGIVYEEEEEEEEEEEVSVKLKNWQLRRLAYALKSGRRKTSIKNLAADLCLERAVVLKLLRDPPPDLLLLSAALPDKPDSNVMVPNKSAMTVSELESETLESAASEGAIIDLTSEEKGEVPIHVMQGDWSSRKRLKKVQVGTLERVYRRSKRPTNSMIVSIVHVTNLPRKRVVKWFEEKRAEDGIPDQHLPFNRSSTETALS